MAEEICEAECLPSGKVEDEPHVTLNLGTAYNKHVRIITGTCTINIKIHNGKLGKITQTELIRK